jgi:hypothetical protein
LRETSFVSNVASGVDHLGLTAAPIIFTLAQIDWESPEERDSVYRWMGGLE